NKKMHCSAQYQYQQQQQQRQQQMLYQCQQYQYHYQQQQQQQQHALFYATQKVFYKALGYPLWPHYHVQISPSPGQQFISNESFTTYRRPAMYLLAPGLRDDDDDD
ncbi:hypothetical protein BGZ96_008198, partial [Linnemannia gamsii]